MFLILLGRAAFVFPLSALSNCMNTSTRRSTKITFNHQVSSLMPSYNVFEGELGFS